MAVRNRMVPSVAWCRHRARVCSNPAVAYPVAERADCPDDPGRRGVDHRVTVVPDHDGDQAARRVVALRREHPLVRRLARDAEVLAESPAEVVAQDALDLGVVVEDEQDGRDAGYLSVRTAAGWMFWLTWNRLSGS
jgi:hypothetical protein